MNLLCFDISSGGITAALLDSRLEPIRAVEGRWTPAASLPLDAITDQFKQLTHKLNLATLTDPVTAVSIGTFLHNFVLLDGKDRPLTHVFTWLDSRGKSGLEYVRGRLGSGFHERTGCRYHPMFPIFKLASLHLSNGMLLSQAARAVSVKSFLVHALTGSWAEDHGIASASGLYNILDGRWDSELLNLAGVSEKQLPPVRSRTEIVGNIKPQAAQEFGLPENVAVVNGSGDGFLANIGSGCETPDRVSVTLGTSAVVRQTLSRPVLHPSSGTFCCKGADDIYVLGCAGSNGGNVLDWGRSIFGTLKHSDLAGDPPIFIPLLHGERSPDWNPELTGSWHGLKPRHTAADLAQSILEGVIFNLGYFLEIVQNTSGITASDIVLSGNGFLEPLAALILATIADTPVWMPTEPGLASLRGSGICALRALGRAVPPLQSKKIDLLQDPKIRVRYRQYLDLRITP